MVYSSTSYGETVKGSRPSSKEPQGRGEKPRCWKEEGFQHFQLEPLTPVFVGSGEDLSPLEYVIRKGAAGSVLHIVDGSAWLADNQQDSAVSTALNAGDMLRLRRLMAERLDEKIYSLTRLPITSEALAQTLLAHITNPRSCSNAEVQTFVQNQLTHTAIVPGSSLKGAISTAIIDHLDTLLTTKGRRSLKDASVQSKGGYKDTLEVMFGKIREHTMQALKVGDISVPTGGTRVYTAREMRLKADKPETPKTPCECLPPFTVSPMPLYGRLHLDCRSGEPAIMLPDGKSITWEKLVKLCNDFYHSRFTEEWKKFYGLPHFAQVKAALGAVQKRIDSLDPSCELLLRVGHYSHIECVTVTNNAPQCKKGFGHTRTLANGELPFGWVVLRLCSKEEYHAGVTAVEQGIFEAHRKWELAVAQREAALREAVEQQNLKAEAAARIKAEAAAEALRREHEAAEQKAMLDALPPEEQAILILSLPGAEEKQSTELFAKIDSFDAVLQSRAAAALKAYWDSIGKWKGKLSSKQEKKVKKIKAILGE